MSLGKYTERAYHLKERVMRRLVPGRMHSYPLSWPLLPAICPCDVHLCEYIVDRQIRRHSIFHFGTGGHHVLGRSNSTNGLENDILAITASPKEHTRYVRMLLWSSDIGRHYKVLFGDIYDLRPALLPAFDLVTLFHLCEFTPPPSDSRRLDDHDVLTLFCSRLRPGGRLIFYEGSMGFPATRPLLEKVAADGTLTFDERYKSLVVYRTRADLRG